MLGLMQMLMNRKLTEQKQQYTPTFSLILAGFDANSGEDANVVSSSTALVSGFAASAHF